ncbi:hypothetical protein VNO80_15596 [Phaseolus coccineus]|uniref:Uncharacterized protein n=1 Tax=Phaseolus coccineus TaxID=3886 RepID=A0AAN9R1Y6_PHACN
MEENAEGTPDTTQMLMEMMEAMRKQNEERVEEFRRAQEEMRREGERAREMLEYLLRIQNHLQQRNEELEQRLDQQVMGRFEEGNEDDQDFQPFSEEILREPVPTGYVFPRMRTFAGKQDPGSTGRRKGGMRVLMGVLDLMREKGEVSGEEGDTIRQGDRIYQEGEVSGCHRG